MLWTKFDCLFKLMVQLMPPIKVSLTFLASNYFDSARVICFLGYAMMMAYRGDLQLNMGPKAQLGEGGL